MGKKKNRERKKSVFISCEGKREQHFVEYLQQLFDPNKKITLYFSMEKGGNSNKILDRALKGVHEKRYAWFDEDCALDVEHKQMLEERWMIEFPEKINDKDLQLYNKKMRNPIIIVSTPLSVEGILIRLFSKKVPTFVEPVFIEENFKKNKQRMKTSVKGFMRNLSDIDYYKRYLSKELILEKAREISELKLLLTIFNIEVNDVNS